MAVLIDASWNRGYAPMADEGHLVGLTLEGFIAVPPGAEPGFDHADCYRGVLIYVAHTGADRIDVLDVAGRRHLRSLDGLPGVAGVLIDEQADLLFSSDRGCARVSMWRCSDERQLGQLTVGPHPNGLAYDPTRRLLHVFNLGDPPGHNPSLSVVDVDGARVIATLPLPGRPRWAMYDHHRDVVFANIAAPACIIAIDAEKLDVSSKFNVPVEGPHGLAIHGDRLYCAADGGAVVVMDADTGGVVSELPLPGVPDVVWHDPERQVLYVAVGEPGSISVFDTAQLRLRETVMTEDGAHTSAWDQRARRLYVFEPDSLRAAVYVDQSSPS
jgi:DNA-binding beta-propeller fold protein YncE